MGLDHGLYKGNDEVVYWRKEPALHDWFQELADEKGIVYNSFNCVKVPVTAEDLTRLIDDIKNKRLNMERTGSFFGSNSNMDSDEYEDWEKRIIDDLSTALVETQYGEVHYDSWW